MINKLQLDKKYNIEYSFEKIDRCIGLVPYYCNNPQKISSHLYLVQTLSNMFHYVDKIFVFYNNSYDFFYLKSIKDQFGFDIDPILIETTNSLFLPVNSLNYIVTFPNYIEEYDYILFNESDQILYMDKSKVLEPIENNVVLNFHRLNKPLFETNEEMISNDGDFLTTFNGKPYYINNYRKFTEYIKNKNYSVNTTVNGSYGAAYLCNKKTFLGINFFETNILSLEHSTIHLLEQGCIMLKTKNISDAIAIHLSGIGNIYKQIGFDIEDYPEVW
jgi:hypothetical protein